MFSSGSIQQPQVSIRKMGSCILHATEQHVVQCTTCCIYIILSILKKNGMVHGWIMYTWNIYLTASDLALENNDCWRILAKSLHYNARLQSSLCVKTYDFYFGHSWILAIWKLWAKLVLNIRRRKVIAGACYFKMQLYRRTWNTLR